MCAKARVRKSAPGSTYHTRAPGRRLLSSALRLSTSLKSVLAAGQSRGSTLLECSRSGRVARAPIQVLSLTGSAARMSVLGPSGGPTANLLLGRIPADHFLGGEMKLDVVHARKVLTETIGKPLGISVDEACAAIIEVANASMLKMLRIVTVEKGLDPADFHPLWRSGGNGPVFGT